MSKEHDTNESKPHFFDDARFQLLKRYQQEISELIEVSPSIRKMINELINPDNLEQFKLKFINQWRNS